MPSFIHHKFLLCCWISFLLCIGACRKKEKTVQVEKDVIVYKDSVYKWKRVQNFVNTNNEFIKNVHSAGAGFIFFAGIYSDAVYDSVTDRFYNLEGAARDIQLKPLLTDAYKLELYEMNLNITPHNNLPDYPFRYSERQLYISAFDKDFTNFYLGGTLFEGEVMGNNNTLLIAYKAKNPFAVNYIGIKLNFDPSLFYTGNSYIRVDTFKIYRDSLNIGSDRFIGVIGDNLLFMMGNKKNYLLNAKLDTVYINNTYFFNGIFHYKTNTYSMAGTMGANCCKTCLIKTNDNGLTWQEIACGLQMDFQNLTYTQIGDKLIAFSFGDQLWEITLTDNGLTSKELVNDGLANKRIKGINMCNGRVFVSTESGVFERPFKEFVEYK